MKLAIGALVLSAGLGLAAVAAAEPYTDWTPQKGATQVTTIKVDPNHVDDYLTGLRQGWVPGEELAKKHGVIDWYLVNVKLNGGAGANVMLVQHYPSLANLEPDKARDTAMIAEGKAIEPKEKSDARIAGYEKYRTFVSDEIWTGVEFPK
ncbi:MAG TPA: hypothetical protein VGF33_10075 [Caulobacteraceae bacterium]|jgi:hypothetical protein